MRVEVVDSELIKVMSELWDVYEAVTQEYWRLVRRVLN